MAQVSPVHIYTNYVSHKHKYLHTCKLYACLYLWHMYSLIKPQCWVTDLQQNNVSSVTVEISHYVTGMQYKPFSSQQAGWTSIGSEAVRFKKTNKKTPHTHNLEVSVFEHTLLKGLVWFCFLICWIYPWHQLEGTPGSRTHKNNFHQISFFWKLSQCNARS